ncbi:hypothetical protein ACEWY4_014994 [Coilia grayii]|uniref:ABC transporter domain-containing protein n=1 Tax=Coilia grayii TaxID=363190 RepID=A0ABD1JTT9_9TELE
MGICTQLLLLLWKNFTYRRRNKIQLLIELLWPLFLFLILIAVRRSHPPYKQSQCHFPNKALPSAGTLAWVQGIVCNINNPCFHHPTPGETPGQVGNFNNSILSRVLEETRTALARSRNEAALSSFQELLDVAQRLGERPEAWPNLPVGEYLRANETFSSFLLTNGSLPRHDLDALLRAQLNFQVISLAGAGMRLTDIVCNGSVLERFLRVEEGDSMAELQESLCAVPPDTLQHAEQLFLSHLDYSKIFTRERLRANLGELRALSQAVSSVSQQVAAILDDLSQLSGFSDLNSELRLLSPENRSQTPLESFRAFSRIICGHPEGGVERIPSFNWYEDHDIKSFLGRNGTEEDDMDNDNVTTPFCKSVIHSLEANPLSRVVWRAIKPLLIGKLLFTPDTPAVQQVMREVNKTFQDLHILEDIRGAWEEIGPRVKAFMESSVEVRLLQDLLRRPEVAVLVNMRLENTSWTASRIAHFLSTPPPGTPRKEGARPTWADIFEDINNTISTLAQITQCFSLDKLEGVATEGQMIDRALELLVDRQFWAGIVFLLPDPSAPALPPHVSYKIRMDIDDVTRTNKIKDKFWDPGPAAEPFSDMRYVWGGFVYVQDLVEQALTRVMTGRDHSTAVYLQQMPYPCFVDDVFLRVLNRSLPMFMTTAWIYSVAMIIKCVVYEKEARLKETMRIMGLGTGMLWLSWFISSYVPFLISAAMLVSLLKVGDILPYSDPVVVFFFLAAFATATISLCFLISTFFSRANLASACGGLLYFTLYLPYVPCVAWRDHLTTTHRVLARTSLCSAPLLQLWSAHLSALLHCCNSGAHVSLLCSTAATLERTSLCSTAATLERTSLCSTAATLERTSLCSAPLLQLWSARLSALLHCCNSGAHISLLCSTAATLERTSLCSAPLLQLWSARLSALLHCCNSGAHVSLLHCCNSGAHVSLLHCCNSGAHISLLCSTAATLERTSLCSAPLLQLWSAHLSALLHCCNSGAHVSLLCSTAATLERTSFCSAPLLQLWSARLSALLHCCNSGAHVSLLHCCNSGAHVSLLHCCNSGAHISLLCSTAATLERTSLCSAPLLQLWSARLSALLHCCNSGAHISLLCSTAATLERTSLCSAPLLQLWSAHLSALLHCCNSGAHVSLLCSTAATLERTSLCSTAATLERTSLCSTAATLERTSLCSAPLLQLWSARLSALLHCCNSGAHVSLLCSTAATLERTSLCSTAATLERTSLCSTAATLERTSLCCAPQSFLSPVAFGFGCEYFAQYEEQGVGIQWTNMHSSPTEGDKYNFAISIVMLYIDAFIYGVLAWYIEAVFPGEFGIPKPWYFIFQMNYWGGVPLEQGMPLPPAPGHHPDERIEPEPHNLVLGVAIRDLVKIYKKGGKVAVNHLNLKFYEGQITSFLGHNGAGKTTTISILTGLFPPTAGSVYVRGMDIRYDMDWIRRTLGVCPQHNILFDILTVEEHVWFYGRLKGLDNEEVWEEMTSLLEDVGLLHKRHEEARNLSGGMKRKLSVAIAFIGGSRVVVLDEPTAGVDPYSRRAIWDLLLKYRKDRTIILSTHYMDEAELLGDRIAIISQGRLCCCGSPLYLKAKLGTGYYLTVVKREVDSRAPSTSASAGKISLPPVPRDSDSSLSDDTGLGSEDNGPDVPALVALAQHHMPEARLVQDLGREAVLNLPHRAAEDGSLALFLAELEKRQLDMGITSYGLSDTTLEEVG